MSTVEFRVRPVIRHVVTRFTQRAPLPEGQQYAAGGGVETLGEFDSEGYADIVAEALRERVAPREYVVVQQTLGEVQAAVYYATGEDDLAHAQCQAAAENPGQSFRVYSRIKQPMIG
jgi:hypothetical protein